MRYDAGQGVGVVEGIVGAAARLEARRICGVGVEDLNLALAGEHAQSLVGRAAAGRLC